MSHNTKLAFKSFKKASEEEKRNTNRIVFQYISSKVTKTSVFLLYRSS